MQGPQTKTKHMISLDYSSFVTVRLGYCRMGADEGNLQVMEDVDVMPENYHITNYK